MEISGLKHPAERCWATVVDGSGLCDYHQQEANSAPSPSEPASSSPRAAPPAAAGKATKRGNNLAWLRAVQNDHSLPSRAKAVAAVMALVSDARSMECSIGGKLLRERASMCKDTTQDARADLVRAGWLVRLRRGNNLGGRDISALYRLSWPELGD